MKKGKLPLEKKMREKNRNFYEGKVLHFIEIFKENS